MNIVVWSTFLFSQTNTDLLLDIIIEKIDAVELVRMELRNRGLSNEERFVAWKKNAYNTEFVKNK